MNLSHNFLTTISKAPLAGLINLLGLVLYANQITAIEPGALLQFPRLYRLDLSRNRLKKIPADIETLVQQGKLTDLLLENNPLEQDPVEVAKLARIISMVRKNSTRETQRMSVHYA